MHKDYPKKMKIYLINFDTLRFIKLYAQTFTNDTILPINNFKI